MGWHLLKLNKSNCDLLIKMNGNVTKSNGNIGLIQYQREERLQKGPVSIYKGLIFSVINSYSNVLYKRQN